MLMMVSCLFLVTGLLSGSALAMGKKSDSMICPTCNVKAVTKARPKGGSYTQMKHLCPSCGQEHKGTTSGEKIHVCNTCDAEISLCPVCKKKS